MGGFFKEKRMGDEFGSLSTRANNCLKNANIRTVKDLEKYTIGELRRRRNIGKKAMSEIIEFAQENGIYMKSTPKLSKEFADYIEEKKLTYETKNISFWHAFQEYYKIHDRHEYYELRKPVQGFLISKNMLNRVEFNNSAGYDFIDDKYGFRSGTMLYFNNRILATEFFDIANIYQKENS